ncbi:thioredoxin fold domain-containing protein [Arcobacter sp. LA11]|uniref:thioredoxin family protein n=1 Tax=Arcobacter sp. LA11 TaxID=1898176 RepID=UPI0009332DE9|nr:thioredoxin fold domain-containing protein [Arcobacter sp. LA11]
MYFKKLISILFTLVLTFTTINAADKKIGNFIGGKDTTMPSWFINSFLDFSEDIEDLSSQNKRFILFAHQDSCPYCHLFVTKNLSDKKTKEKLSKYFGITDINIFGNREVVTTKGNEYTEKEFALKEKIQFTPTLIFFDEEGKQILRLNGYINTEKFNLALDYIKDKKENTLTYKEYLTQNNEDKQASSKLIEESDLFKKSKNFMRTKDSKKMAIFFESKNCKDCEMLHNKLLKDETTRNLLKKIDLFQVDMNSSKSIVNPQKIITKIKDWTKELNIVNTPTIIFFDEKANEIMRIEAIFKNFHFQSIVDYVVSNEYKKEKEFQRYLTKRANAIREKGIDVNIWE